MGRLVLLVFVIACFPLLYSQMPPTMDYPNHLARLWLLAGGAAQAPLSGMYIIDWSRAATNVGVDWTAAQAAHLLGITVTDRLLRLAIFLGPPLGAALLGRTLFGRFTVWHIAPIALCWTTTSIAGFMSYSIALAAALFAVVLMMHARNLSTSVAVMLHVILSAIILAVHPFGLLFYLALLSGVVIGPSLAQATSMPVAVSIAKRIIVLALISASLVVALFLLASHPPSTSQLVFGSLASHLSPKHVLLTVLSPVLSYNLLMDLLLAAPVAAVAIVAGLKGWLRVHGGLVLVALVLAFCSLIAPEQIGDATWLDRRLPLMAALTLVAAILPEPPTSRVRTVMIAALLVAILGRITWITGIWIARDADIVDMLAVTQHLKAGQTIVVVRQDIRDEGKQPIGRYMVGAPGGWRAVRRHLPALLVPYKHVFIPTLFSVAGQQPLRIAAKMTPDSVPSSSIPTIEDLWRGSAADPYLARLHCDFDYVLLIGADEKPLLAKDFRGLRQVAARGWARLYVDANRAAQARNCARAQS